MEELVLVCCQWLEVVHVIMRRARRLEESRVRGNGVMQYAPHKRNDDADGKCGPNTRATKVQLGGHGGGARQLRRPIPVHTLSAV